MEYPFQGLGPALHILALVIVAVMCLAVLAFAIFLAMLPGMLATKNHHPQTQSIRVLGFVGLPTGFLWCIALAWALWKTPSSASVPHGDHSPSNLDSRLTRIEALIVVLESQPNKNSGAKA